MIDQKESSALSLELFVTVSPVSQTHGKDES